MANSERIDKILYTRVILEGNGDILDFEEVEESIAPLTDTTLIKLPFNRRREILDRQRVEYNFPFIDAFLGEDNSIEVNKTTGEFVAVLLDYEGRETHLRNKNKFLEMAEANYVF